MTYAEAANLSVRRLCTFVAESYRVVSASNAALTSWWPHLSCTPPDGVQEEQRKMLDLWTSAPPFYPTTRYDCQPYPSTATVNCPSSTRPTASPVRISTASPIVRKSPPAPSPPVGQS